ARERLVLLGGQGVDVDTGIGKGAVVSHGLAPWVWWLWVVLVGWIGDGSPLARRAGRRIRRGRPPRVPGPRRRRARPEAGAGRRRSRAGPTRPLMRRTRSRRPPTGRRPPPRSGREPGTASAPLPRWR